jgi:hypothetical protein
MRSGRNFVTQILTVGKNTRPAGYQMARLLLLSTEIKQEEKTLRENPQKKERLFCNTEAMSTRSNTGKSDGSSVRVI